MVVTALNREHLASKELGFRIHTFHRAQNPMKDRPLEPATQVETESDDSLSSLSSIETIDTNASQPQHTPASALPPSSPARGRVKYAPAMPATAKPSDRGGGPPQAAPTTRPSPPPPSPSRPVPLSGSRVASKARASSVARAAPDRAPATAVRIAIDARTRSSRLFFVLLHLVGVSTNVPPSGGSGGGDGGGDHSASGLLASLRWHRPPSWFSWSAGGIVGVHPAAVLLERLDVRSSRRGLGGLVERVERAWGWESDELLGEPYWFQDDADGQCLGPGGGFSECGDATLWRVRRKPLTRRQSREKRYRARHGQWMREEKGRRGSQQNQRPAEARSHQGSSTSSVCAWPFVCEEGTPALQHTGIEYDEIYGFEYENLIEQEGFALQLTDVNVVMKSKENSFWRRHKRLFFGHSGDQDGDAADPHAECLLSFPSDYGDDGASTLHIGSCSSEAAWLWHVNRDGILVRGSTRAERRRRKRVRWRVSSRRASAAATAGGGGRLDSSPPADFGCVHRTNSTLARLLPCDANRRSEDDGTSLVGFSLVKYPSALNQNVPRRRPLGDNDVLSWEPWTTLEGPSTASPLNGDSEAPAHDAQDGQAGADTPEQHLPTSRTSSQNHASAGAKHSSKVDLMSTASMLHTSLEPGGKAMKDPAATSASHIRDAPVAMNGVAFHNQLMDKADGGEIGERPTNGPSSTKLRSNAKMKDGRKKAGGRGQTPIHDDPSNARGGDNNGHPDSNPHRPRKIPVHPYIQSSKDFVWVDPLTSLEYPTDLCNYLGHTKKEAGRHTLMGAGYYLRTAFNIKVYGAALYVAKRDVLADPKFGEYAVLTADDLRRRGDFYDHLMNMPSPGEDPASALGGFFDRTLFIKTNMQLSTDAMRKSLEADWSLLTEEMKTLIIESSFEERMADETMQKTIQSKENSSNCSCGQSAPPELNADPSCCARGTELVFTWRKSGDFEIRLNGRIMDIFPRSDIAKGIFSEYLNDNPISLDAKAHFADGFPFLLAPLAQVKGMSSAVPNQSHEPTKKLKSPSSHNPMHRLMDAAVHSVGAMNTQAHTLSKWMQDGVAGLSEELHRQQMELLEGAVALQKEGMGMLTSLIKLSSEEDGLALTIVNQAMPRASQISDGFRIYDRDAGLKVSSPEIIPDEIGIKIEPTMNFTHRLFFTTVHVYLLLLFVVSLQGSHSSRLVVKRRILETKKFVETQSHGAFAAMSKLH